MTAVEWLEEILKVILYNLDYDELERIQKVFDEAKEMEKQQMKEMYLKGIENYDPTFKKKCEHCYITSADWKSQTCTKCHHRINF
jgi:hypothetical protein